MGKTVAIKGNSMEQTEYQFELMELERKTKQVESLLSILIEDSSFGCRDDAYCDVVRVTLCLVREIHDSLKNMYQ